MSMNPPDQHVCLHEFLTETLKAAPLPPSPFDLLVNFLFYLVPAFNSQLNRVKGHGCSQKVRTTSLIFLKRLVQTHIGPFPVSRWCS